MLPALGIGRRNNGRRSERSLLVALCAPVAALLLAGCPTPQPLAPEPLLIADPPPTKDGHLPGAAQSALDRGMAYVKNEAYDKALPHLERALAANPQNAEAQYFVALCFDRTGQPKRAEAAYKTAIDLDGKLTNALVNLGALYLEEPVRPKEAIEVLAAAAEQEPKAPDVHLNLALAYRLNKQYEKSGQHYAKALALKDDGTTHFAYSDLLVEAGKLAEAVEEMRKALPTYAKDLRVLTVLAHRFGKAKAYKDCVSTFDIVIKLKSSEPGYYLHRGLCKHGLQDESGARADYTSALKANPKFQPAYYYMGMSYFGEKKRKKAVAAFKKAIKLGEDTKVGQRAKKQLKRMAKQR